MLRRWPKIVLRGSVQAQQIVCETLLNLEPIGVWEEELQTSIYFGPEHSEAEIRDAVRMVLAHSPVQAKEITWEVTWEREQDWMEGWREYFRPLALGRRIIVKPPWGDIPSEWVNRDVVIEIEPKMAFGTGTHATTQLMLEAEETLVQRGMRVLDVGTGSGILAIAAALLGAGHVVALDVDGLAVQNAKENLLRNGVVSYVSLFAGELRALRPNQRFDLLLANIRTDVHRQLVEGYVCRVKAGGYLVLSGILQEEADQIRHLLQQFGLSVERIRRRDEWVAIEARAPGR